MDLPRAKAPWFLDMHFYRIGLSRLTRILVMILYEALHKLIGLKWLTNSGEATLGMRVILVWLMSYRGILLEIKSLTRVFTMCLVLSQHFW